MTNKIRNLICVSVTFCIVLSSCASNKINCNTNENEIMESIASCQREDGGVASPAFAASSSIYSILYDTYYSCLIAEQTNNWNTIRTEKIKQCLGELTRVHLLQTDNKNLSLIFFYYEIAEFVKFEIPSTLNIELKKHIYDLFCEVDFSCFANTQDDNSEKQPDANLEMLESLLRGAKLLNTVLSSKEKDTILTYYQGLANALDLSEYTETNASIIAHYLQLLKTFGERLPDNFRAKFNQYGVSYLNYIYSDDKENTTTDIGCIYNLVLCCDLPQNAEELRNTIESLVFDRYNGFVFNVFPGEFENVVATHIALQLLYIIDLDITQELQITTENYLKVHTLYNGMFSYVDSTSTAIETYYAWKIMQKVAPNDNITSQLNDYLAKSVENCNYDNRDMDTLYIIRYAIESDQTEKIPNLFDIWDAFLSTKNVPSDFTSISNGVFLHIIELMQKSGYTIPAKKECIILEYLENLSENLENIQTKDAFSQESLILRKSIIYQSLSLIDNPIPVETVYSLISFFIDTYDTLPDKLLVTQCIVALINEYNLDANCLLPIKNNMVDALNHSSNYGLFSFYGLSCPTFEATYFAMEINTWCK